MLALLEEKQLSALDQFPLLQKKNCLFSKLNMTFESDLCDQGVAFHTLILSLVCHVVLQVLLMQTHWFYKNLLKNILFFTFLTADGK